MGFAFGTIFGAVIVFTIELALMWFYGKVKSSNGHHYQPVYRGTYCDYYGPKYGRECSDYDKGFNDGWKAHKEEAEIQRESEAAEEEEQE